MDLNEVISLAKKNRKEATNQKKVGYSTEPKGAKKLQRNVDPSAVQAFLRKKKKEQMKQLEEAMKKKESLQKLRVEVKHTKKANAMAKRTKDNLQVYKGEDYLGLHKEVKRKEEYPLSDEDEMRHKAFMDKLYHKTNRNGFERGSGSRHDSNLPPSEEEKRKRRKQEKNRERARMAAAGLDFNSLLNLAGKQKKAESDEESDDSSISTDTSDDEDANGKYEREKRKRKELEAKLKELSRKGVKRKSEGSSGSSSLKIGKLDKGLTEENKQAKIKAIMEKFKKKSSGEMKKSSSSPSLSSLGESRGGLKMKSGDKSSLTGRSSKLPNPRTNPTSGKPVSKSSGNNFKSNPLDRRKTDSSREAIRGKIILDKKMQSKTRPNPSETKVPTNPYLQAMKKTKEKEKIKPNNTNGVKKKPPPNPYAELLEKAKQASASTQCTLSVSSAGVRTNYPTTQRNNDFPRPSSASRGPQSAAEEYRRRLAAAQGRSLSRGFPNPATLRRHQVLDSDEDEYDSEMEGFIDDDGGMDEAGNDISAQIGAIFGYNRNKYGRESEYELSKMDASYKDIEKEEKRSLRIAKEEDAKEARLEEERNRRAMMKKAKK